MDNVINVHRFLCYWSSPTAAAGVHVVCCESFAQTVVGMLSAQYPYNGIDKLEHEHDRQTRATDVLPRRIHGW